MSTEVPPEYSDAYERAYRHALAEHPTELMSAARPGKRASEPTTRLASWGAQVEKVVVGVLADPRRRGIALGAVALALVLVAYGLGRVLR